MKRLLLLLAMPTVAAAAQSGTDPVTADWVAGFRAQMQSSEDGMRITGVRAQGQVLILQVALAPNMPSAMNPETVVSSIAGGMCADAAGATFFTAGRRLRTEVSRNGRPVGAATLGRCPGPIGLGYTAETFAASMQPLIGRDLGEGVTITALRAEGSILVVTMNGPAGWRQTASHPLLETSFLSGFCEDDRPEDSVFVNGLGIRIDTTDGGQDLVRGRVITACP